MVHSDDKTDHVTKNFPHNANSTILCRLPSFKWCHKKYQI